MRKKILFIGPYTAIGGVSMHIKRLSGLLKDNFDFEFIDESPVTYKSSSVFNLRSGNLLKYLTLIWKSDIVHIHTSIWWLRGFHILTAFLLRKKIVVSFHALLEFKNSKHLNLIRNYTSLADKVIVVNSEMYGILKIEKAVVKEAFIPPDLNSEPAIPVELNELINQNSDKKLIVSNAFRLDLHNDEDLYGLDLMVDVAKQIKTENKPYKIIFVVASQDDKFGLMQNNQSIIEQENLSEQITIFNNPISFVKLIEKSDLVVRATNTDGDALTIREALYLEKPVIASDVVQRPEGTILFENRNSENLFVKINEVISDLALRKISFLQESYKDFYFNLY
ncbi:glycosyltransferase family 4 protein [Moheibacter sediminis]|uniref:Glycosyltransferase involved in cell wall bisynthesis n=1 Tax=Moheibacter sediminis TaxID=1434700 RepID=A0A1W1YAY2_9FLAO|nr:glycosyltransferase family 4 protein [Moheibacter sediminis]SMC33370.1 Glycosyltransferase involved in cell wall bisynthesis [Moheibacter sediminis]